MKRSYLFFLVVLAIAAGVWYRVSRPNKPLGVVVMLLDTTRADHLGVYGYERNTTPQLNKIAEESLVFDYAVTAAPWTPPSVASIFTGMYVTSHGVMPPNGRTQARKVMTRLGPDLNTLSEIYRENGYRTAAVSPNPWITPEFGFDQGFEQFQYLKRVRADEITKAGTKLIDSFVEKGEPFFLYLHYLDPHDPYDPPKQYDTFQGPLAQRQYSPEMLKKMGRYDGEISYLDQSLGKFFGHLKELGIYDRVALVVVGDHGEQFEERGNQGHGFQLFDEELHVPLVIKTPFSRKSGRVPVTVSTIDIFPTLLEISKLKYNGDSQGVSLLHIGDLRARRGVFSEINRVIEQKAFLSPAGMKLIIGARGNGLDIESEDPTQNLIGIYERSKDPFEQNPIHDPALLAQLQGGFSDTYQIALARRLGNASNEVEVEGETLKQLQSLGYLQ